MSIILCVGDNRDGDIAHRFDLARRSDITYLSMR
jgi:hypothetical protein